MTKKRKSNKAFIALAVLFALLSAVVWLPKAFGLEGYYVKTGSMEPNVPKGSMVYIEPVEIEDVMVGADVLLFSNEAENKSFTHRVMRIDYLNGLVYTKGDANDSFDPLPTAFESCRGRVVLFVPYLGFAVQALDSAWGKAAVALVYIVLLAVALENCKSKKKAVKE